MKYSSSLFTFLRYVVSIKLWNFRIVRLNIKEWQSTLTARLRTLVDVKCAIISKLLSTINLE